ncbi:MAG: BMP family ABC transporter substrate-binding protein [Lachnospiraceae bacterium]|nr:BMP family ABC transporter substrate-binding protein [Lachnospiraceae bacterium]
MKSNKWNSGILLVFVALILVIIFVFIATIGERKTSVPKVGVVMTGAAEDSGWNGMHYQGIKYACDELGAELLLKENVLEGSGDCVQAIHELAQEGAALIILTSYAYPIEVKDVIGDYPDISFYAISAEYYAENMTSYFGRMYQARYLAGIVAGLQTETNQIGYVAAMANAEVNRGINAFTLGARSVNPQARIHVVWTEAWDNQEKEIQSAEVLIKEKQADVITYHQNQHHVAKAADEAGVYSIGYNEAVEGLSDKYLTAAVWDWNALYYEIVKEYFQGRANAVKRHWFGIDTGVIKLADFSSAIREEAVQAVEEARQEILSGKAVFSGKILDNTGTLRCDDGENISDEILLEKLDWYVDGVSIYEETIGNK